MFGEVSFEIGAPAIALGTEVTGVGFMLGHVRFQVLFTAEFFLTELTNLAALSVGEI